MKKKIVFVGSHLSAYRGTKGISEKISSLLEKEYDIFLVSRYENKVLRLVDILWSLLKEKFDIVHIDVFSNKGFIYANLASKIARLKKTPIVMTLHGGMLAEKYEKEPEYVRSVLARADVLQSPSQFLKEFFGQHGFNVQYMPNFIDLSHFPYGRNSVSPYSLLWVRAFSPEYRPELAVKVLYELLKKYPDVTLTMIGPDKGSKDDVKHMVGELGLEKKIMLVGRVPNEELYHYYQSHAVYLNTTLYESFGVAVMEAAACGIPVVSTKVGEIPYLWEDSREILMSDANVEELAQKITLIFNSETYANQLSINARKKAELFDWENSIKKKWINLFEKVGE